LNGIVILSHNPAAGVLVVTISHLSESAFFAGAAPTALDPAPEPNVDGSAIYLPVVMSEASGVTSEALGVTSESSDVLGQTSSVTDGVARVPDALYLPMVNH